MMNVTIDIYRADDNIYIACCPELNLYTNSCIQKDAVAKLKKKITEFMNKSKSSFDAMQDISCTTHYYSTHFPRLH